MTKTLFFLLFCSIGISAWAQKPVRSAAASGTPNRVPVFTDSSTVADSDISDQAGKVSVSGDVSASGSVSGNVGNFSGDPGNPFISPNAVLGVTGVFIGDNGGVIGWDKHVDNPSDQPSFNSGIIGQISNTSGQGVRGVAIATSGNARGVLGRSSSPDGIGVRAIAGPDFDAQGNAQNGRAIGILANSTTTNGIGIVARADSPTGQTYGVQGLNGSDQGIAVLGNASSPRGFTIGIVGVAASPQGTGVLGFTAGEDPSANTIGIRGSVNTPHGTAGWFDISNPQADLIAGLTAGHYVFRVDSVGTVHSGPGADIAEHIDAFESLTAGDVVEIDPQHEGHFRKVTSAHSILVAGVVSTAPGVEMGNAGSASGSSDVRPLLALAGRVPVKVTNEAGAIRIGDLLTSSSRPGFAMRCVRRAECGGEILGKALQPLSSGTGTIEVLVTLQ